MFRLSNVLVKERIELEEELGRLDSALKKVETDHKKNLKEQSEEGKTLGRN